MLPRHHTAVVRRIVAWQAKMRLWGGWMGERARQRAVWQPEHNCELWQPMSGVRRAAHLNAFTGASQPAVWLTLALLFFRQARCNEKSQQPHAAAHCEASRGHLRQTQGVCVTKAKRRAQLPAHLHLFSTAYMGREMHQDTRLLHTTAQFATNQAAQLNQFVRTSHETAAKLLHGAALLRRWTQGL